MSEKRVDLILVESGKVSSRTKAQELIEQGWVQFVIQDKLVPIKTCGEKIDPTIISEIRILPNQVEKYVSRAGLKLEGALEQCGIDVKNKMAIDIGISTGGFSDCLLSHGAKSVVGIEVGHGQLHNKLKTKANLSVLEGLNAKEMGRNSEFLKEKPIGGFEILVMDVSFISVLAILPEALLHLREQAELIILIKPQFEAGPNALDKNGIIRDPKLYPELLQRLTSEIEKLGCKVIQQFESFPSGKDGNREFFFYAKKM